MVAYGSSVDASVYSIPHSAFMSNHTAACHPVSDPVEPASIAVGVFLIAASALAPAPQIILFVRSRSSAGVSVLTPALTMCYGFLNAMSTVTLKWPTLQSCTLPGGTACLVQLLDLQQQGVSTLAVGFIMLLAVTYPPNNRLSLRCVVLLTLVALGVVGAATVALSIRAPCSHESLRFAQALGVAAAVLVCVAFIPQLVETCRMRGRGNLSYLFYAIQSVGCGLVVGLQLSLHDSWPVWGPTMVSGLMQLAILLTGLSFVGFRACCAHGVSLRRATIHAERANALLAAEDQRYRYDERWQHEQQGLPPGLRTPTRPL